MKRIGVLALLAWSPPAGATLGEPVQGQAQASQTAGTAAYAVYQERRRGGITVRQYALPSGVVFAVSWAGPFRPDLQELLGRSFAPLQEHLQQPRHGRAPVNLTTPGLVVHMGGHQRAFFGHAYLPNLLPPGLSVDQIK